MRRREAWVSWEIRGGAGEAAGCMSELGDQRRSSWDGDLLAWVSWGLWGSEMNLGNVA